MLFLDLHEPHSPGSPLHLWWPLRSPWALFPLLVPYEMTSLTIPLSHLLVTLYLYTVSSRWSHLFTWFCNGAFQSCIISPGLSPGLYPHFHQTRTRQNPQVLPPECVPNWAFIFFSNPTSCPNSHPKICVPALLPIAGRSLLLKHTDGLEVTLVAPSPSSSLSITMSCRFYLLHISQLCPIHPHCDHQGPGHPYSCVFCIYL